MTCSCMLQGLRTPTARARFKPFTAFYEAAAAGTLPPYTFLTPRMFPTATHPANDQVRSICTMHADMLCVAMFHPCASEHTAPGS